MRNFYFRPHIVLTLIIFAALVVLIKLGLWQKDRLEWKTDLLAAVDAAAQASPLTSSADIIALLDDGEFTEFRRVDIQADSLGMDAPFLVFTARNRDITWRTFQLVDDSGHIYFADTGLVADDARENVAAINAQPIRLVGYIRTAQWQDTPRSDNTPDANRWFGFNPLTQTHDWAALSGYDADMRFFIETVPGAQSAQDIPPKRPDIANNHFEYMLTWFSLAILLCVFYVLIHIRDGRAGRRS